MSSYVFFHFAARGSGPRSDDVVAVATAATAAAEDETVAAAVADAGDLHGGGIQFGPDRSDRWPTSDGDGEV